MQMLVSTSPKLTISSVSSPFHSSLSFFTCPGPHVCVLSHIRFLIINPKTIADMNRIADRVSFGEGHGTGTGVGDPVEVSALASCFTARDGAPLMIGSVC